MPGFRKRENTGGKWKKELEEIKKPFIKEDSSSSLKGK